MEIIDELEPVRRGPYAGAVATSAGARRCSTRPSRIRTCVIQGGTRVGAGRRRDRRRFRPSRGVRETEAKARRCCWRWRSRQGRGRIDAPPPATFRLPLYRLSAPGRPSFELPRRPLMCLAAALSSDFPGLDPTISRRHAELRVAADGVAREDLGSSNGTQSTAAG